MSDATDTMSVQLVLCVADSVWRAAVLFIPLPSHSAPVLPRPQLLIACWLCCWLWPIQRTIGVIARQ